MAKETKSKIGEGHAGTMGRLGLEELRNATYPSSNVAEPNSMYGLYGTKTPGEVQEDRRPDGDLNADVEPKKGGIIDRRLEETKSHEPEQGKHREMEMELD